MSGRLLLTGSEAWTDLALIERELSCALGVLTGKGVLMSMSTSFGPTVMF